MNKSCNLSTVKNTPSEARRSTPRVDYYYIDFCDDSREFSEIASTCLSRVVNVIYDYLEERDIFFIEKMYVCARVIDGTTRRIFEISINNAERYLRISRVK